ncbi:MAG: PEP-CTERM sorting domain-containing protein [Sedimentisphaerales bacterium]|nr:PEP-CTERM sorting domain-containing protein [Sedimentisphaerales bacterium]
MKKFFNILLVYLCCLGLVSFSKAEIITIEVTGIVDSVETGGGLVLDDSINVGSEMLGYCIYDTETPDLATNSDYTGLYELLSICMEIGNYTFTHNTVSDECPLFLVGIVDPGYKATSADSCFDGIVTVNGTPKTYDDIIWGYYRIELMNLWSSSYYIPTDSLPTELPDISVFDNRREFEARFYEPKSDNRAFFDIHGELTSLNLIPEPATILLFGLASLILTIKRLNSAGRKRTIAE